jgi:hypothetical protein
MKVPSPTGAGPPQRGLREHGPAHSRRLSGFAYAKFCQLLQARCQRDGIDLAKVNPAFPSLIGRTKCARGRATSTHHRRKDMANASWL